MISAANFSLESDDPSLTCNIPYNFGCTRTANGVNIINPIQSANLRTIKSYSLRYGKVEIVAQMPRGDWIWPALWLLPVDDAYGGWPLSGEIDIAETVGNDAAGGKGNDRVGSALHWGVDPGQDRYEMTMAEIKVKDVSNLAFFSPIKEWTPEHLFTYLDDPSNVILNVTLKDFFTRGNFPPSFKNPWLNGCEQAPFDMPFYLIMNVAVGGTNGYFSEGQPWNNSNTGGAALEFWNARERWLGTWRGEEAAMKVDRVRVWELC
ncbi:hypothetical protein HDU67_007127 [Dinochytrium kinnereticum]|nr:hypothetical protein HDU67_007127 [Dinochytrium kinnereticum]